METSLTVGIDPGVNGTIALVERALLAKSGGVRINNHGVRVDAMTDRNLLDLYNYIAREYGPRTKIAIAIEKLSGPLHHKLLRSYGFALGASAMFADQYGDRFEITIMTLPPQVWQFPFREQLRGVGYSERKKALYEIAKGMCPDCKKDEADAILMALTNYRLDERTLKENTYAS